MFNAFRSLLVPGPPEDVGILALKLYTTKSTHQNSTPAARRQMRPSIPVLQVSVNVVFRELPSRSLLPSESLLISRNSKPPSCGRRGQAS